MLEIKPLAYRAQTLGTALPVRPKKVDFEIIFRLRKGTEKVHEMLCFRRHRKIAKSEY